MDAIILAGGRGERLMPFTADRPKCLVEVAGRPLIAHQLAWLARQSVKRAIVSCGYRWEKIQEAIGNGSAFGLNVDYAPEEAPLGRGGGLRNALQHLHPRDTVVACNGDVLTSLRLRTMLSSHRRSNALASLLLVPCVLQHGVVEIDAAGRVTGFREKPALPYWLSGGVYLLEPEIERRLPKVGDHETTTWPRLAADGLLNGYRYKGFWQSVDSPKDVSEADKRLRASG